MAGDDSSDLFAHARARDPRLVPLAERMRPHELHEVVGQSHLVGPGGLLRGMISAERLPSVILWGPPGSGKTTLARVIARGVEAGFEPISATHAGVKDVRAAIERSRRRRDEYGQASILFIDEIHRFHKGQQDALLPHVEAGVCTLIGATTENPSFEINAALLSRARVLRLEELGPGDLLVLLRRALSDETRGLGARRVEVSDDVLASIARTVQGDARRALDTLELAVSLLDPDNHALEQTHVAAALERPDIRHDKAGEGHYNVVSALIKSMRASDLDASVYWLGRMLEAGEDPMFVARRLVIFASEDVGNADPQAIGVATAAASATHLVGMPEAVLPLTQAALYLALAPKSNAVLRAYAAVRREIRQTGALPVPLEVRNAVTDLMKKDHYGRGYRYPHDFSEGVVPGRQSYLPQELRDRPDAEEFVRCGEIGWEAEAWTRLERLRRDHAEAPGSDSHDDGDDDGTT